MKKLDTWKFIIQVLFSSVVIGLCVFKLADPKTSESQNALYWGGLLGIIGYWLPSPGDSQQDKQMTLATGGVATTATSNNNGQVPDGQEKLEQGIVAQAKLE